MKITYNKDKKTVENIKKGLQKKGGHCPCKTLVNEDTLCMCREFRNQINDPDYEGYCSCMLYYKTK